MKKPVKGQLKTIDYRLLCKLRVRVCSAYAEAYAEHTLLYVPSQAECPLHLRATQVKV